MMKRHSQSSTPLVQPIFTRPISATALAVYENNMYVGLKKGDIEIWGLPENSNIAETPESFKKLGSIATNEKFCENIAVDHEFIIYTSHLQCFIYEQKSRKLIHTITLDWNSIDSCLLGPKHLYIAGTDEIREGDWKDYEFSGINSWNKYDWEDCEGYLSHIYGINGIAINPKNSNVSIGFSQGDSLLWETTPDLKGDVKKRANKEVSSGIRSLAFVPDGKWLLVGDSEKTHVVKISKFSNSKFHTEKELPESGKKICSNSKFVAICSDTNTISIWEVASWKKWATLGNIEKAEEIIGLVLNNSNICVVITEERLLCWKIPNSFDF